MSYLTTTATLVAYIAIDAIRTGPGIIDTDRLYHTMYRVVIVRESSPLLPVGAYCSGLQRINKQARPRHELKSMSLVRRMVGPAPQHRAAWLLV